ncbi:MAG: hypothetical protein ACTSRS_07660 [Candidatus Helarchaeota archaeon]
MIELEPEKFAEIDMPVPPIIFARAISTADHRLIHPGTRPVPIIYLIKPDQYCIVRPAIRPL